MSNHEQSAVEVSVSTVLRWSVGLFYSFHINFFNARSSKIKDLLKRTDIKHAADLEIDLNVEKKTKAVFTIRSTQFKEHLCLLFQENNVKCEVNVQICLVKTMQSVNKPQMA